MGYKARLTTSPQVVCWTIREHDTYLGMSQCTLPDSKDTLWIVSTYHYHINSSCSNSYNIRPRQQVDGFLRGTTIQLQRHHLLPSQLANVPV
jgi:hypothetical protein